MVQFPIRHFGGGSQSAEENCGERKKSRNCLPAVLFADLSRVLFPLLARKMLIGFAVMNNARHVPAREKTGRRVRSTKARPGRPRKSGADKNNPHKNNVHENVGEKLAADETIADERVIRARGLLAATLRVWELKHRISE